MIKKRILYVLSSQGGGASLGHYEMLRGLPRDRYEPYAVAPPGTNAQHERMRPLFQDVRVFPLPWWDVRPELGLLRNAAIALGQQRRGITMERATREVLQAIRDWKIDLVHTGTALTLSGPLAAKEAGVPHVWHVKECVGAQNRIHFPMPDSEMVAYFSDLSKCVITMSDYIAQVFRDHHCPNVEVLPDGVELEPYLHGDSRNLRKQLGLTPDQELVGMVAGLTSTWKRHEVYVRMVAELAKRRPQTQFIAIGPRVHKARWPHDLGKAYCDHLLRLADQLAPPGRLQFLDFIPDPPDIMRSLDVLVHTCDIEPFGRIAIEAMAAGTPVVGPTSGGIAETVVDGETGLLAEAGNPSAFADATERLLADPDLRRRLGAGGQARARTHYSLGRHVEQQIAIYKNIFA